MAEQKKAQEEPRYGLVLDFPGAAAHPYRVGDLGEFSADQPTPIEELGLPLDEAKKLDNDEGCPLKLVKLRAAAKKE